MEVRYCKRCGKLFNYTGVSPICDSCRKKEEEAFEKVKKYLDENPRSDIRKISEDTEVSTHQINQWIREERLELSKDSPLILKCERCGAPIRTGRFCNECKMKMASGLNNAFSDGRPKRTAEPLKPDKNDRMRFMR